MDFKTNQQVLSELSRRLKEVKAHWKGELNPYLQLIVKGNELSVRYASLDEKTFGCFRFPLDEVVESGVCLIALEDWLGLNVRWKRTGLVRLSVAYPELVIETLDGVYLRIPTHSFYFPELLESLPVHCELSVRGWQQLVLNQTRTLANQHPLKEYEYVWLFEEEGKVVFQSANETEWSCSQLTLVNVSTTQIVHAFDKTQWLALKQMVDKNKVQATQKIQLGWNERFVVVQFPQEVLLIEREMTIPCYLLNQTNWQPSFIWDSYSPKKELEKIDRLALSEAFKLGGKLPKNFTICIGEDGNYSTLTGFQLPYRSLNQYLKDDLETPIKVGISKSFDSMPIVAFRKKIEQVELLRFFTSTLKRQ